MGSVPTALLGEIHREERFRVIGLDGTTVVVNASLQELKGAWQRPFKTM